MRRSDLLLLALGGCMRIYPDPDLPDLTVRWDDFACAVPSDTVDIVVIGVDTPTTMLARTATCADLQVVFADIARERFHVVATLPDAMIAEDDVDLRAGFNKTAQLFFQPFQNVQVAWQFDPGVSCASLGATAVMTSFSTSAQPDAFGFTIPCEAGFMIGEIEPGVYSVKLVATSSAGDVVGSSPASAQQTVIASGVTDFGVLAISPCPCP